MTAMNEAPQKVQVFGLGRPRPGTEGAKRRHYVKWRIDGRDRTRAFRTRAEADRYRSRLLAAAHDGTRFDEASGLPDPWLGRGDGPTWWSWSQEWLALKWPQWSGHSRRSAVEVLVLLTPLLHRDGAPKPPDDLAGWLRNTGFRPGLENEGPAVAWLERWSIPLEEIEPALVESALTAVCSKANGQATAPSVARRRRGIFGAVLRMAVREVCSSVTRWTERSGARLQAHRGSTSGRCPRLPTSRRSSTRSRRCTRLAPVTQPSSHALASPVCGHQRPSG